MGDIDNDKLAWINLHGIIESVFIYTTTNNVYSRNWIQFNERSAKQ